MKAPLSIIGIQACDAEAIRLFVFGWVGWSIAAAFILFSGGIFLFTDNAAPLVVSLVCLFFSIHIITLFVREYGESVLRTSSTSVAHKLSPSLLRNFPYASFITPVDLLRASLLSPRGKFLLEEMNLTAKEILVACESEVCEIDTVFLLEEAIQILSNIQEDNVDASVFLSTMLLRTRAGHSLLAKADISDEDMIGILKWESFRHRCLSTEKAWSPSAIRRNASLGRSWVMGYTDALDSLTTEMNVSEHMSGEDSISIHKDLIERSVKILASGVQKNLLLLGAIGTGRRTLVRNIATAFRSLQRRHHLPFTRVLLLHTEQLLSGTQNPDAFLLSALSRASSGGTFILVIPDFAQLLISANTNVKTVLMKCLESSSFGVIGIAETQDYHSLIKPDAGLDYLFEKVDVDDATEDETMSVLMAHWSTAHRHKVHLTYKALRAIITLSERYLSANTGMPGKALLIMNEAVQRASERGDKHLTEDHVREVVSIRGKVNVQKVGVEERERLMNLESVLSEKVIDQPNAIRAVSGALKRARIDLSNRKRPIGAFLFLGPTGVGKTQTAKALAAEYFGSSDAMIRLDMNEYSQPESVFSISGNASGGDGFLARRVQDKPFSLILLDEIEKAHPSVLNLFLQILDEGFMNDALGVRTDFRNTIIIATSNAGALFIRDYVRDHTDIDRIEFKKELLDVIIRERVFSPEFINRFDETVLFYPLSEQGVERVAVLMLDDIVTEIKKKRGIDIRMEADVVEGLVERGYSIEFGAREMRRTITDIIEDYLANYMLAHDVKRGETITVRKEDLKW